MQWEVVLSAAAAATSSFAAVGTLGWWLSGQFRRVEQRAAEIAERVAIKAELTIKEHEVLDQRRHDENMGNFQRIFMALARAKLINGSSGGGPLP